MTGRRRVYPSVALVAALAGLLAPAASATTISITPLTAWQTNGRVDAIVIGANGWTYLAGTFTQVKDHSGGVFARTRMAAIDASGHLTAFDPKPNAAVRALALGPGGTVYLGGDFTTVAGTARNRLAAVTSSGGLVTAFAAGTNGPVYALAAAGSRLYVGGNFSAIRSVHRTRLARVAATTGAVDPAWTPTANALVRAIAVPAGARTVFVGGTFTKVDGTFQDHLASLAVGAGATRTWATHPRYAVWGLAASGTTVYLAGAGHGGHLTALAYPGGALRFTVQTDGNFQAVALVGQDVVGGGHFTETCTLGTDCAHPVAHARLLAADAATGAVDRAWNPQANSLHGVYALAATASDLYAGGDFTSFGATPQQHFAEFALTP
jgi:hypothetical protein